MSWYFAVLFTILKHCSRSSYLIKLLRSSQFWNIADVYPIFIHCWEVSNLETLRTWNLSCYVAVPFPILKQCWGRIIILHCQKVPNFGILLTCILSCYNYENFRFLGTLQMYIVSCYIAALFLLAPETQKALKLEKLITLEFHGKF